MLASGVRAPAFGLEQLKGGPVVLAFFKVSCPVCQLTFPFLDRIAEGLRVCGVSQDDARATAEFNLELGIHHIETVLDAPPYPASRAFGLSNVPSIFVIESDGIVSKTIEGFSKAELEELGSRAGVPVFAASDRVPNFRPG